MSSPLLMRAAATLAGLLAATPLCAQEVDHSQMEHAQPETGHDHAAHGEAPPQAPIPVLTDADRLAARPSLMAHEMGDEAIHSYTLVERAEAWRADGRTGLGWEAAGWIGGDINRLWWRTEGEHADGSTGNAELQALFGHSFAPRWDWVAGLRQDYRPRESRSFVAFGLQGLAPQWFEIAALALVGEGGRTAARFSTEYSVLLTNRLVLRPVLQLDLHGKDDLSRGIGSGLSTAEAGLRLRYEFTRQFAPYMGLSWERAFGDTAGIRRATGEAVSETRWVAGLRVWF
jgi:copper resistance protein B